MLWRPERCELHVDTISSSTPKSFKTFSVVPRSNTRLLQGWDHTDSDLKWNIPVKWNSVVKEDSPPAGGFGAEPKSTMLQRRTVPHSTVLPGLQFSLAGILGKPETFYQVPVIRFIFEIFGYA